MPTEVLYKKIAIVGISGSGKSQFARLLSGKAGLPIFHMDSIFWKGNWEAVSEREYLSQHKLLLNNDRWIIDGYVDKNMADRLAEADLVIYLDYSGLRCAFRLLRRWFKHRKESRPELPIEARERFNLRFFWLVFSRGERHNIEEAIKVGKPKQIRRFYSPRELDKFLEKTLWN